MQAKLKIWVETSKSGRNFGPALYDILPENASETRYIAPFEFDGWAPYELIGGLTSISPKLGMVKFTMTQEKFEEPIKVTVPKPRGHHVRVTFRLPEYYLGFWITNFKESDSLRVRLEDPRTPITIKGMELSMETASGWKNRIPLKFSGEVSAENTTIPLEPA